MTEAATAPSVHVCIVEMTGEQHRRRIDRLTSTFRREQCGVELLPCRSDSAPRAHGAIDAVIWMAPPEASRVGSACDLAKHPTFRKPSNYLLCLEAPDVGTEAVRKALESQPAPIRQRTLSAVDDSDEALDEVVREILTEVRQIRATASTLARTVKHLGLAIAVIGLIIAWLSLTYDRESAEAVRREIIDRETPALTLRVPSPRPPYLPVLFRANVEPPPAGTRIDMRKAGPDSPWHRYLLGIDGTGQATFIELRTGRAADASSSWQRGISYDAWIAEEEGVNTVVLISSEAQLPAAAVRQVCARIAELSGDGVPGLEPDEHALWRGRRLLYESVDPATGELSSKGFGAADDGDGARASAGDFDAWAERVLRVICGLGDALAFDGRSFPVRGSAVPAAPEADELRVEADSNRLRVTALDGGDLEVPVRSGGWDEELLEALHGATSAAATPRRVAAFAGVVASRLERAETNAAAALQHAYAIAVERLDDLDPDAQDRYGESLRALRRAFALDPRRDWHADLTRVHRKSGDTEPLPAAPTLFGDRPADDASDEEVEERPVSPEHQRGPAP